jgi:hypothetical protein
MSANFNRYILQNQVKSVHQQRRRDAVSIKFITRRLKKNPTCQSFRNIKTISTDCKHLTWQ